MRKLLLGLVLVATACTKSTTIQPAVGVQSVGPRPALDAFLNAARTQDLQAMSAAWGDKDGAIRDSKRFSRDEIERRELIMMCYFKHDRYRVLTDQPASGGERVMAVELSKGTLNRVTNFYLADAGDRWYVRAADLEPVKDLCAEKRTVKP